VRRTTTLGAAFVSWTAGAPVLVYLLAFFAEKLLRNPIPCPFCSEGFCVHRALGHSALHVLVMVALAIFWQRAFDAEGRERSPRIALAAGAVALLAFATAMIRFASIYLVFVFGPPLLLVGSLLVSPSGRRPARIVGALAIAAVLASQLTILGLHLGPEESVNPVSRIGLCTFLAALAILIIGWANRHRPDVARAQPTA
jgi:hypothetical protein